MSIINIFIIALPKPLKL